MAASNLSSSNPSPRPASSESVSTSSSHAPATPAPPAAAADDAAATNVVDLDAYLRRIGFPALAPDASGAAGGAAVARGQVTDAPAPKPPPTLDTLRTIARLHPAAIPFENLNPLLRWPVKLDLASLQQKLIQDARGGWCFEQNGLLLQVLRALGFTVTGLAGRVVWNQSDEAITPRTHMVLKVDLEDGARLVDVGFGGMTLTGPMTFDLDVVQATPHESYRLTRRQEDLYLQVSLADSWRTLYRFSLQEQYPIDYEISNWYLCTHPDSHFLKGLVAARAAADRRYSMRNNQLTEYILGGGTVQHMLTTGAELRAALEGPIGLTLPADSPELEALLAQVAATPPPSTA